jgi:SAM-dependent methyltransferase
MASRFGLDADSHVVEVAANDGYLLQYVKGRGIPCTGVEPTAGAAAAARGRGIPIVEEFFGARLAAKLAAQGRRADLAVANNVLAHVPDVNDFVAGFAALLEPQGVATFEFPHLLRLVGGGQFDTIYHEHFSYLSLTSVSRIFAASGLEVFDVEELPTHGGSLRVFAQRAGDGRHPLEARVDRMLRRETLAGLDTAAYYAGFQAVIDGAKDAFVAFLLDAKRRGRRVAAYGAAAKGNTLLNYAGVRPDLIPFVVDRNPAKQGKYLPGSRIPIVGEARLGAERPDHVVILPWNIKAEIVEQLRYVASWGGGFVTAVPSLEVS